MVTQTVHVLQGAEVRVAAGGPLGEAAVEELLFVYKREHISCYQHIMNAKTTNANATTTNNNIQNDSNNNHTTTTTTNNNNTNNHITNSNKKPRRRSSSKLVLIIHRVG